MPLSFADVYNLYREAGATGARIGQQDLSSFAKDLNVWTDSKEFDAANTGKLSGLVKKGSYWADVGLEKTRLPEATGWLGEKAADAIGVDPQFGREVGASIPRMAVDFAPMIATGLLAAGSAPVSAPVGIGALIGSGALGAANAWEKSGKPLQAATGFAMPLVGAGASKVASGVSSALLSRLSQYMPAMAKVGLTGGVETMVPGGTVKMATTVADKLADYLAGNVGATVGTEALERGVNGSPGYDLFSKESVLANVVGQLPFAVHDLYRLKGNVPIPFTEKLAGEAKPIEKKQEVLPDEATIKRAQAEVNYRKGWQDSLLLDDPVERVAMQAKLATDFKEVHDLLNPPAPQTDKVMGLDKQELQTIAKNPWVVQIDPARQALRDKITQPLPPKVETPQQAEDVIIQAGAKNPWTSNYWTSKKIVGRVNEGETPAKAVQKVAQAMRNKEERKLSPTQKEKLEKEGQIMGELFTRAAKPEDVEAQQILAAIKPIYDNPDEYFTRTDIDKSQLKAELPSEVANIYNEWETARREGTPFGKSAEAKPIAGMPLDQQIGVLVGSLKNYINTYGFKMPKEVARGPDDKPMAFATKEEAQARLAELGEGYKVGAYGKGKFAVFKKTPAMAVSKADVDATTAVVEEIVNSAATSNDPNLGTAERGVGEIAEEVIENEIAVTPDSTLVDAVLGDEDLMKLIESNPELKKVKDTMMETLSLNEAEAARELVGRLLSKSDVTSSEGLKKVLRNLMIKQVSEESAVYEKARIAQKAAMEQLEEQFNNELAGYEDAEGNEVPGFVEKNGQKWTPKDYANAIRYANKSNAEHQQGLEHFGKFENELKKKLLDKYLAERAPETVRAMLARIKAGNGFAYTMVPFDPLLNKLGRHPLPKGSSIEVKAFKRMATETGELKDVEIEFYKQLVPEAFGDERVNVRTLAEGLSKKGPVVETKKLQGSQELNQTFAIVLHEVEGYGFDLAIDEDGNVRGVTNRRDGKQHTIGKESWLSAPIQVRKLLEDAGPLKRNQVDTESRYSWLSPVAESDMQGYVEGLVRVPLNVRRVTWSEWQSMDQTGKKLYQTDKEGGIVRDDVKYTGPHFGSEDTNVLAFFRGFETTLPDGRKAFRVIEHQTDWFKITKGDGTNGIPVGKVKTSDGKIFDSYTDAQKYLVENQHPLADVWTSLGLKAAIKHAQEIGAEVLLLDDAETVMMTEGHDKIGIDAVESNIKQAPGMRLHYDTTLPSEMRRLTGEKGEVVDTGMHEKAASESVQNADGTWPPVGSPVFRNADGTPKTNSTSLAFSLKKVPNKEFSLFNSRFLLGGEKASGAPTGSLFYRAKALQKGRDFVKLSDAERNSIWKETGWMLAPDGKWRFEIDDSRAKVLIQAKDMIPGKGHTLQNVLNHPELLAKYPQLKDIYIGRVKEDNNISKYGAAFYPAYRPDGTLDIQNSAIVLHPTQYGDGRDVILHELQHVIQEIEGFSVGSNPRQLILAQALPTESRNILKSRIIQDFLNAGRPDNTKSWNADQWDQALVARYGNHLYHATLGEVEARKVVDRSNSMQFFKERYAPLSSSDTEAPYFSMIPGLGSSFSIKESPKSRSYSEHHFEMPSFVRAFGMALENRGVDFETAREIAGKIQSFLPSLNLDDVRFGALVNDVKGGREVLGLTNVSGPLRKMWLAIDEANRGKMDVNSAARDAMIKLAHEAGHVSEWLRNNNKLDAEGMKAHEEAEGWFASSEQDDVAGVLNLMRETFLPKEWQELPAMKSLMEYTTDPKEAMATAYGLWNLGMVSKGVDAQLLGSVAPKPVRSWLRDVTTRALDVISSIKTALGVSKDIGTKARREQVDQLVKNFQKVKRNLEKGQENLDKLNKFVGVDSGDFELLRTSDIVWEDDSPGLGKLRAMLGRKKPPSDLAEGVYRTASRFGEYLEQFAARNPKMAEAAWSILSAPGLKGTYMHEVMSPILGEADPLTGKFKPNKERAKQLEALEKKESLRVVISDIKRFQNRKKRFFDPAKDVQLASKLSALNTEDRKAVQMYLEGAKVKTKVEQQKILEFNEKMFKLTGMKILSSFNPGGHKLHESSFEMLWQAEQLMKAGDLQNAAALLAQADAQIGSVDARMAAQKHVQDSQESMQKLAKFFEGRPWFSSEIQTGRWRVIGFDKQNGQRLGTVAAETLADVEAVKKAMREDDRANHFELQEVKRGFHVELDEDYKQLLEQVQQRMEASLNQTLNKNGVSPQDVHEMIKDMNLMGHMQQFAKASNPVAPQTRRLSKQAESLDMVATDKRYSKMMATVLVNNLTKSKLEYELMNPEIKDMDREKQFVKEALENYLKPDSELGKMIVKIQSPYLLGLNLPNHFAEMFQSFHTILPEAIRTTGSVRKSAKVLGGVLKDLMNFYVQRPFKGGKEAWDHWGSKEEKRMMEKFGEEGLMTRHAYNEGLDDEGMAGTVSRYRATGSKMGGFIKSKAKAYSDFTMGIYENFTRFNMRIASLMGYRMARANGMSHEAAVDSARRFAITTTFSSGRAGRPTALFGGNDNTLGMIAYAMQRYSLGWMGMFGRHLQHGLVGAERANEIGLSPQDRTSARKAAVTMAAVQFASAGALGLPFVGAMTTILEKMLGQNIKGDVYEWFGQMMDEDEEEGGMLADVLMRGAANAMLDRAGVPIDLASKFALGGTPGFSELQGFDSGSIFGPTASLVKSLSLGVQALARDGDVAGFARQAFPPGLRKAVDLLANGDATSREGSKLGLDDWNQKLYALGFTPDKVRKMRDFERFNDANEIKRRRESAKQGADILSMLETDPAGAMMKAQELVQQSDGSLTLREIAGNVAEQAVKKEFPKDPRSDVTRADQGPAAAILRGMGLQLGDSQELEKAQLKNQILAMFGVAPRNLSRPAAVDQMALDDPWLASFSGAAAGRGF